MLSLQDLSYIHPNKDLLFEHLNLSLNHPQKMALIGSNGAGKSTLLKIIAGELQAGSGQVSAGAEPYYIPQIFGQFNHLSVAEALKIDQKINALRAILNGRGTDTDFESLNDDWSVEERCAEALLHWGLKDIDLQQKMSSLSGGQKTKVFLAGILIHKPALILLDEPSNHLDHSGRALLYNFIQSAPSTLLVVSHDRKLLDLLDIICELGKQAITVYGGNYSFYVAQKAMEQEALYQDLKSKEKILRKAKEKERDTLERQQKLDARGKGKQEKSGVSRIMMNTLRNSAEKSTAKIKGAHTEKIGAISKELHNLKKELPELDQIKFGFGAPIMHKGKVLFAADQINVYYSNRPLWTTSLRIEIRSSERIALKGLNGSGKTSLIKIILGQLKPQVGSIFSAVNNSIYVDQDYSLINNGLQVYEQAQVFNTSALQEHEIKIRLNRFLFSKEDWNKPCQALSGGEKMRLMLCCLTISDQTPDLVILDEPTNNLDIQNIEILTAALNSYKGSLLVVSHDEDFLRQIHIERQVNL